MQAPTPAAQPRRTRTAARSRWLVGGITAAVAVGSVAAMAEASRQDAIDGTGNAFGVVTRHGGEAAAAALMAAADPGDDSGDSDSSPPARLSPRLGIADVS